MAQPLYLYVKLDDTAIPGDSRLADGSIECVSFWWRAERESDAPRSASEIKIVTRIDKVTPKLLEGCGEGRRADVTIKFFQADASGSGENQHFFTVAGANGRITSVEPWVPDMLATVTSTDPPLVLYTMAFRTVTSTYAADGATYAWAS
jgi:type VI secretion system Hcp family effector